VPHPDGVTSMFPGYAFFDVLLSGDQMASGKAPAIPPSAFKDKLVFIGTSAAGLHDRYATPFRAGAAGVELHATLADNVLSERVMRVASRRSDLAITIGVGVLCGLVAALMPVSAAIAIVLGVVGALAWWVTRGIGHWRVDGGGDADVCRCRRALRRRRLAVPRRGPREAGDAADVRPLCLERRH
jgi:hypothetical protein